MTEHNSAKFFVRSDGSTVMQNRGDLTDKEITKIQRFIKENYIEMYQIWRSKGGQDFFEK